MKTAKLKLHDIKIGCTFEQTIQYLEEDRITPVDLTGCTIDLDVRTSADAPTSIFTLTSENGYVTLTPLQGEIHLEIPKETTLTYVAGTYVYGLAINYPDGTRTALIEGSWEVKPFAAQIAS